MVQKPILRKLYPKATGTPKKMRSPNFILRLLLVVIAGGIMLNLKWLEDLNMDWKYGRNSTNRTIYRLVPQAETTMADKLILLAGEDYPFLLGHFRKSYVRRSLALRKGIARVAAPAATAAPLHLRPGMRGGARLPHFYLKRPVNADLPLNARDLAERDIMMPEKAAAFISRMVRKAGSRVRPTETRRR